MTRRLMILAILLLVALPSVLYARWIKDKVYLQTESVGNVEFSHYTHLEMESIGNNCPTCHNGIFHIVTKKNPLFTMADMEAGKACGVCHNGKQAFSVAGDCTTCHTAAGEIAIQTENVGKVVFSHDVHIGSFGCNECHPDIFKAQNNSNHTSMKAMADGTSCGACHDGSTAFSVKDDCTTCHAGDIEYANADAGNVTFPHKAHTGMFGCDECHPDLFKPQKGATKMTMEAMEKGESCGACHDGSSAFGVAEDCESCHKM
jgi:c(7)-type cytochrome triheme protein